MGQVLLLDEPLANLDAQLREEMRFFIRSLQKRVGITTVYVTHDQAEAMAISDRIVVMSKGRISQLGKAEDIYMRPSNREVASFIGVTNFIDGVIVEDATPGSCLLDTPLGVFQCRTNRAYQRGTKATMILRPEAVTISRERRDEADVNSFPGTVSERIYQGNLCGYRVRSQGLELQIQAPATIDYQPESNVWCSVPKDKIWLVQE